MREVNAAAVAGALAAGVARVYRLGEVPAGGDRKYPYAVVAASFDQATTYTLEARHGVKVIRLTTQAFGRTVDAALDIDQRLRDAFLDERLPVAGWDCDPAVLQVGGAVVSDPDAGQVIGVTSTYLFTATKEN